MLLGVLCLGHRLMIFGPFGVVECGGRSYLGRTVGPVVPLQLAALPFLGRGLLRIRSRCLGGRAVGGTGDPVGCIGFVRVMRLTCIVLSTLLTLLMLQLSSFRRRLKGIRNRGSSGSVWVGCSCWVIGVLCVVKVRVVLSLPLVPGIGWIPPDLHGFYRWVFDSLELLFGFLKQAVVNRRDEGFESGPSGPYAWLGPDFVPPFPFLSLSRILRLSLLGFLVEPHLVGAEFRKAWMPFFCRSGHPVVTH